jgi:DNA polymerase elongation subunit (family B)
LLALVAPTLPPGIELEYDGCYSAMFCYKAKNYALYDGKKVTLRGSALRSRGIEPYLKKLSRQLLRHLVGAESESPLALLEEYRRLLAARALPVSDVAKSESLSMNPDAYERFIADGGKPRRASAEAALKMNPRPRMGERIAYYIVPKQKGQTSDWQRARPLEMFDATSAPYDESYYLEKIDDWVERYGKFIGAKPVGDGQGDLMLL